MASRAQETELLAILIESGTLTDEQANGLRADEQATGKSLAALLIEKKFLDEEGLAKARGTVMGLPYADLQGKNIVSANVNLIPKQVAETTKAVAFDKDDEGVLVGMVDPLDGQQRQALDFYAQTAGLRLKYHIVSPASYAFAMKKYEALGKEVAKALEVAKEKFVEKPKEAQKEEKIEEVIKGAPVSRIVSVILRHAYDGGASDIHIEPLANDSRVRYRVDGVLRTSLTLPKYIHASLVARVKVLANLKLDETRVPQDGRITETFNGKRIDFRVSTLPLQDQEKVVMRVLDTTRGVPTLEQLGFRTQYVEAIVEEIRKPHGIFLITGPTGSGKSTTLFTIMNMRNEERVNISTLEDPVEYTIQGVNQSQVRPEVGFTFASGLRALLRQDPNIIMVGEIRDSETGELAVHAALTGHLIFSTIHTNDAMGVVPRLMDMHIEPFLLSATFNMAIAQRLARKICERCKTSIQLPPEVEARVRQEVLAIPLKYRKHLDLEKTPWTFYKGRGCTRCNNGGYVGRVAVGEIFQFDEELKLLIAKGFPVDQVQEVLKRKDFINLRQDALLKALEGWTTIEDVMRITSE